MAQDEGRDASEHRYGRVGNRLQVFMVGDRPDRIYLVTGDEKEHYAQVSLEIEGALALVDTITKWAAAQLGVQVQVVGLEAVAELPPNVISIDRRKRGGLN